MLENNPFKYAGEMNVTITKILKGNSLPGNTGCTNGNYNIPVCVRFSDGTSIMEYACCCGNGCNGTFRLCGLEIGDPVEWVLQNNPWTYVEAWTKKEQEDFLNGDDDA